MRLFMLAGLTPLLVADFLSTVADQSEELSKQNNALVIILNIGTPK